MTRSPERGRRPWAAAVALLVLAAPAGAPAAAADDRVDMTSVDIESLLDLSVQAPTRRVERASEAPATVFVVTAEDIRRHGFRTLAEVLSSVPGLYSYPSHFREIGVRGMGLSSDFTTRVLVLVDGHPLTTSVGTDVARGVPVPLEAVQRVEVIKGPAGAVYGPSALFGVVNLVTTRGAPGGTVRAGAEGGQGEVRGGEAAAAWRGRVGPVEAVVAADAYGTKGFDHFFPEAAGTPGAADGVARGMDRGRAAAGYARVSAGGLAATASCGEARTGLAGALPSQWRNALETTTCFADVGWQARPTPDLLVGLRVAADDFEASAGRVLPEPPRGAGYFVDEGWDRWGTAELRADWRPARWLRADAGSTLRAHDVQHESRSSAVPSLDASVRRRFTEWNAWGSAEVKVGRDLTLHGGVNAYRHSIFGSQLTPRAAVVWQPSRDDTAKAIWSNGFRPPTFVEAIFTDRLVYLANPDLRPEKVTSGELAYEHRLGGFASAAASLFWNRYTDLIVHETVPAPGLTGPPASAADFRQVAVNEAGHLDVVGGELALTLRRGDAFQAYGGVSVQRPRDRGRPDFPAVIANLAASSRWPWRPLLLAARAAALGPRSAQASVGEAAGGVPAAWTLSLLGALEVPGARGLQVEAAVLNVLDAASASPAPATAAPIRRFPDAPRTFRADLRWSF